mmetsp:Transcript_12272/g.22865  ORF Transcript_12272/g.22865 Transcript_12272/m.22865 type:complete len:216 (+) Transcript_12272:489-1136(+)|eukprot:CAMPEP_0178752266 /NCGR_PEP_ID=MMETSP0744-20121128/10968_1 /TAXON_ID=913974 /ORGANISM="Nitzschia punctata, Strain CCMP561" /LENGTH=215 /DNA_ID=CAMNT_0020405967 /DNA_START=382 /DNA_END=1029 /DNA_ORIENTATION=-
MASKIEYDEDNDCYAILDVKKDCDQAEVKRAYRRLVLQLHPDKQPSHARKEAHGPFVRMQNAFEILNDPTKRSSYNAARRISLRAAFRRRESGRELSIQQWWAMKEAEISDKETMRRRNYDNLRNQWRKQADTQEKEARQRREDEAEKQKKQRHEGQKNGMEIKTLLEEKATMDRDFKNWEAKQGKLRESEVEDRRVRLEQLSKKHEQELEERGN